MNQFWNFLLAALVVSVLIRGCVYAVVADQEHRNEIRAERCMKWHQNGTMTPELEEYCNDLGV